MGHNTRVRADLTAWSSGAVDPAEFDQIDQAQFEAVNGDDGGTWAPATAITIGGSGISCTGPLVAADLQSCHVKSGETFTVDSGGAVSLASGSTTTVAAGATLQTQNGATVSIANSDNVAIGYYSDDIVLSPCEWVGYASNWTQQITYLVQGATPSSADRFTVPVPLSPAATITQITAYVEGAAGHAGLIGSRPVIYLIQVGTDGTHTTIGSQIDPELVGGNYETKHSFSITGLSYAMNTAGATPQIRFYGEGGANALQGLKVYTIRVYYGVTSWARI